jgi:hypothetical protein
MPTTRTDGAWPLIVLLVSIALIVAAVLLFGDPQPQ